MAGKIKLAVVDDHPLIRDGLSKTFSDSKTIEIIGEFEDGTSFLDSLTESIPDVVLMDISLKGTETGFIVTNKLFAIYPDIHVIMLTVHVSSNYIFESVKIGARGYFTKTCKGHEIIEAVEKIPFDKEFYLCEEAKNIVSKEFIAGLKNQESFLSDVERKIIELICAGKNNRDIAKEMELSPKTIANYKSIILDKLDSKNDIELVTKAIREKIISNE